MKIWKKLNHVLMDKIIYFVYPTHDTQYQKKNIFN